MSKPLITWRVYHRVDTVVIEISDNGKVVEFKTINNVPPEVFRDHIAPDLERQAQELEARFEVVDEEKDL